MVLVSKLTFFHVFFFGKIGQEKVFDDILQRKKLLQTINNELKKPKNWDFFKGVSSWFDHCCLKN